MGTNHETKQPFLAVLKAAIEFEKSNFKAHRIISIHVIYPVCMVADLR